MTDRTPDPDSIEVLDLGDVEVPEVQLDELPADPDDIDDDHLEPATDEVTGEDPEL